MCIRDSHHRVRTPQALREEHAFITHLNTHGLPVPSVLADAGGHTAIASGEWTYEVHTLATGLDVYRDAASWTPPRSPVSYTHLDAYKRQPYGDSRDEIDGYLGRIAAATPEQVNAARKVFPDLSLIHI